MKKSRTVHAGGLVFYPEAFPSQEALEEHVAQFLTERQGERIDKLAADFRASLTTPRPPLPLLDLDHATSPERLAARWTLRGYVAGLAGGRRPWAVRVHDSVLVAVPDSIIHETATMFAQMRRAWENGYRQGREHRARSLASEPPADVFTRVKLRAALLRAEPLPD